MYEVGLMHTNISHLLLCGTQTLEKKIGKLKGVWEKKGRAGETREDDEG